ncbi:MAG TPA: hypothetical protein VJJ23_02975 [Candidatus Nanoarchaeia archaeon]|nr:hypothetical protein [Candidatus Nanoarchaeia archaeon]
MRMFGRKETAAVKPFAKQEVLENEVVKPIIATARPGLTDESSALMRRLPSNYAGRTVRDVLSYMVDFNESRSAEATSRYGKKVKDSEAAIITSLKNELGAAGSVVVINGKNAKLTDRIDQYLVDRTKNVSGRNIQYQELEIEVSAVQQGGYRF